ncbi:hypothetical protein AB838_05830 [Rhodobacteraceae bacterium (ex Bugula neritina AB1)]|nr:hypothetical protein AB838_05830 [Rhodobacteraceae bacterium (ex Bugula neritina AB1)]
MKIGFSQKVAETDMKPARPLPAAKQSRQKASGQPMTDASRTAKPKSGLKGLFSEAAKFLKKDTLTPEQKSAKREMKSAKADLAQARSIVSDQKVRLKRVENSFDKNIAQLKDDQKQSKVAAEQAKLKFENFKLNFAKLNKPAIEDLQKNKVRLAQMKKTPLANQREIKSLEKNISLMTKALTLPVKRQRQEMENTIKQESLRQASIAGIIKREKQNRDSALSEQSERLEDTRHNKLLAKGQLAIAEAQLAMAQLKAKA